MGCVDGEEVCTAGLPYPGYQKPKGQKHSRHCEWKHKSEQTQIIIFDIIFHIPIRTLFILPSAIP